MPPSFHAPRVGLAECDRHGPGSGAELFVVEGESAGLAVARVRDERVQAVLPMQGKPLSVLKATSRRVAAHPFYTALAEALGTGLGTDFRGEGLRFERILILTDPDADGIHCGVLLLAFLHRFLRPLLDRAPGGATRVGWVRAPWGEVVPTEGGPALVARSEEGLVALAEGVRRDRPATVRRFRGLAAIDAALLARHCIDPATRHVEWIDAPRVEGMLAMLAAAGRRTDGAGPS